MIYLEFLEHMRTFFRAAEAESLRRERDGRIGRMFLDAVEDEIAAEHQRGELALNLAEKKESQEPFRCSQCGDAIWYGERQHVCRGGK